VNVEVKGTEKADRVIAEGEATGHLHCLVGNKAKLIVTEDGRMYVSAPTGAEIVHGKMGVSTEVKEGEDRHKTITLPVGTWKVIRQREYDPAGNRQVSD